MVKIDKQTSVVVDRVVIDLEHDHVGEAQKTYEYYLMHWAGEKSNGRQWIEKDPGITTQDHWFATAEERSEFKQKLKACAVRYNFTIAFAESEGFNTRLRTVARMTMCLQDGRSFDYEHDFGYACEQELAHYMWHDGNYGCDCNRSLFLARDGHDVREMTCGDTIVLENFRVTQE